MGSGLGTFYNTPGLLIVCGGTLAATAIAFPAKELKLIVQVTRRVFRDPGNEMKKIQDFLLEAMRVAKKDGNLGLEQLVKKAPTKPVSKGLQLIADGADTATVREILSIEKTYMEEHHRVGQRIFTEMGKYAPAFGMVGTLIGLVQMLASLSDPSSIGPMMAVALLTTFYGALMANLIFLPMVTKLDRRIKIESIQIELAIVGLISLLRNDNIAIMHDKMEAFMAEQEGSSKAGAKKKKPPVKKAA
jgi:chemotaxis protein MotA